MGGCNSIDKVAGYRIGSDKNKYVISMWKGLQKNLPRPIQITKDIYDRARNEYNHNSNIEFDDFLIGWIGWMGSFNGRFFDGGYSGKASGRDYVDEQIRNTQAQIPFIQDIEFYHCAYNELLIPDNSIIYCDIPYKDTKQYVTSKDFNHDSFFDWCRDMKDKGHSVFVSEYNAPNDFKCIWSMEVTNSMNTTKTYKPIERLFTL